METKEKFFDFAAYVGLTKHLGGVQATDELVRLCKINADSNVLDVGCGAGVTPCYLAKKYKCRVLGVDILPEMVKRSIERAKREGVTDRVEFRVADAQDLPFEDNLFDAVITESVTAFPEDKQQAVNEYVRVTKPGGYIGLNESTWLKVPPPPDVIAWASQDLGASVKPLTQDEWAGLLETAGLEEIVVKMSDIDVQKEAKGIYQRYGMGGMLRSISKAALLFIRNPAYRQFVKSVRKDGVIPDNLVEFFGFGIFVGRKKI